MLYTLENDHTNAEKNVSEKHDFFQVCKIIICLYLCLRLRLCDVCALFK